MAGPRSAPVGRRREHEEEEEEEDEESANMLAEGKAKAQKQLQAARRQLRDAEEGEPCLDTWCSFRNFVLVLTVAAAMYSVVMTMAMQQDVQHLQRQSSEVVHLRQEVKALRKQLLKHGPPPPSAVSTAPVFLPAPVTPVDPPPPPEESADNLEQLAKFFVLDTPSGNMVSQPRRLQTVKLAMMALMEAVPGDFVETGVYYGGTSILMAKLLQVYGPPGQVLWAADSFQGLPDDIPLQQAPDLFGGGFAKEANVFGFSKEAIVGTRGKYRASRKDFEEKLRTFSLDRSGRVKILEGWFNETLPRAPIKNISFLRADGDIYVSTIQTLDALYGKLSIGGFLYVDDYGSFLGCRKAVDEFRQKHNITEPMIPIYEDSRLGTFEAVWWQKRRHAHL